MKKMTFKALAAFALSTCVMAASVPYSLGVKADFQGYSNLHDFQGSVDSSEQNLIAEDGKLPSFEVHVPVKEMQTGNSGRDRNMYSMFQSQDFPEIVASFTSLDLEKLKDASESGIDFDLKIRGVTHAIHAEVLEWKEAKEEISFDLNFEVSLKEMELKAPTAMFGMVRVKDTVNLTTHFLLKTSRLEQLKMKLNQQMGGEE